MANEPTFIFASTRLLRKIGAESTTRAYRRGQIIFAQGDKADAMFYIREGSVKLTVASKRGKKAVIGIWRDGAFFGEGCLVTGSLCRSTATAIQQSTIARVSKRGLVRVIRADPECAQLVLSYLLSRVVRVEEDLVDQLFHSSEQRLARMLLLLAGVGKNSGRTPAALKVSQATLAEMIGTTRSRISHFMNRFREMGLIHYNGSLQVHRSLGKLLLHG